MPEDVKNQIGRYLWLLGSNFDSVEVVCQKCVDGWADAMTPDQVREYIEPFIQEISAIRAWHDDYQDKLLTLGLTIPLSWEDPPIELAVKRSEATGKLELDGSIASQWKAIKTEASAISRRIRCAPDAGGNHVDEDSPPPRVQIDFDAQTITLDGVPFDVKSEPTLRWVKVLIDHPGNWISGPDLPQFDQLLTGARTDKLRKNLPNEINSLIESDTGRGSRIFAGVSKP